MTSSNYHFLHGACRSRRWEAIAVSSDEQAVATAGRATPLLVPSPGTKLPTLGPFVGTGNLLRWEGRCHLPAPKLPSEARVVGGQAMLERDSEERDQRRKETTSASQTAARRMAISVVQFLHDPSPVVGMRPR